MPTHTIFHLAADGVSLILVQRDGALPEILHWGPLITTSDEDLLTFAEMRERPGIDGTSDVPYRPSVLPEHVHGWGGRPGVAAHRAGAAWASQFTVRSIVRDGQPVEPGCAVQAGPSLVAFVAKDDWAEIELLWRSISHEPACCARGQPYANTSASPQTLDLKR